MLNVSANQKSHQTHIIDEDMKNDIKFCVTSDIDYVIQSIYVGKKEIEETLQIINEEQKSNQYSKDFKIIAKLETEESIKEIQGILEIADAILIPRGVLGIVLPIEKISWIQKNIKKLCNHAAKPCILASQFLDSMVHNPFPFRAEVTDIHSAVMDGADCLLLNAETTVGKYPLEALKVMHEVCVSAE